MSVDLIELVWRKQGEERCDWTPRQPTEKKALPEKNETEHNIPEHEQSEFIENLQMGVAGGAPLNKREAANEKMNERYLVGQPIQNPFMSNSNYANDLEIQMNFLTPAKG